MKAMFIPITLVAKAKKLKKMGVTAVSRQEWNNVNAILNHITNWETVLFLKLPPNEPKDIINKILNRYKYQLINRKIAYAIYSCGLYVGIAFENVEAYNSVQKEWQ